MAGLEKTNNHSNQADDTNRATNDQPVNHANVTALCPLTSDLNPSHSLNILPGSKPYVRQPHTPRANAITQSS